MQQSEIHQPSNLEQRIASIANDWFANRNQHGHHKSFISWKKGDTIFIKPNYVAPLGGPMVRSYITTKDNKTKLITTSSVLGRIYVTLLLLAYAVATVYLFFTYSGKPEFPISMLVMFLFGMVMLVGIIIAGFLSIRSQHDHLRYELDKD